MAGVASDPAECLNCGAEISGPFCSECGQKATPLGPTFQDVVRELVHELLHLDGKFPSSMRLLLTRPGALTVEYLAGRRTRYLSPLRLYLICSVVFFAVSALISSQPVFSDEDRAEFIEGGVVDPEVRLQAAMTEAVPRTMFVLVPLCAWLVMAVTHRSKRTFPEHLWFALHVHAAYFMFGALTMLPELARRDFANAMQNTRIILGVTYLGLAIRFAYRTTWTGAAGRALAVAFFYGIFIVTAIGLVATASFL
ncbi:MAG: DUF3667 domain-containing protein [Vicinamibacterales bacterium]